MLELIVVPSRVSKAVVAVPGAAVALGASLCSGAPLPAPTAEPDGGAAPRSSAAALGGSVCRRGAAEAKVVVDCWKKSISRQLSLLFSCSVLIAAQSRESVMATRRGGLACGAIGLEPKWPRIYCCACARGCTGMQRFVIRFRLRPLRARAYFNTPLELHT